MNGSFIATIGKPHDVGGPLKDLVLVQALLFLGVLRRVSVGISCRGNTYLESKSRSLFKFFGPLPIERDSLLVVAGLEPIHDLGKSPDLGLEFATQVRAATRNLAMIKIHLRKETRSTHQFRNCGGQGYPFSQLLACPIPRAADHTAFLKGVREGNLRADEAAIDVDGGSDELLGTIIEVLSSGAATGGAGPR